MWHENGMLLPERVSVSFSKTQLGPIEAMLPKLAVYQDAREASHLGFLSVVARR